MKRKFTNVTNSTNIYKTNNRLFNSDGQQFHQYQQNEQSPLEQWWSTIPQVSTKRTITSLTVMVNKSTSINKTNNRLFNSDGQQFHQYQQNEQSPLEQWWSTNPLVSTKRTTTSLAVMVNNSTSISKTNNHLLNSDGQQFHQYQQNEQSPL